MGHGGSVIEGAPEPPLRPVDAPSRACATPIVLHTLAQVADARLSRCWRRVEATSGQGRQVREATAVGSCVVRHAVERTHLRCSQETLGRGTPSVPAGSTY